MSDLVLSDASVAESDISEEKWAEDIAQSIAQWEDACEALDKSFDDVLDKFPLL
jgi:hypothetical protein